MKGRQRKYIFRMGFDDSYFKVHDTAHNLIFPCDDPNITPIDFVPKLSDVTSVLDLCKAFSSFSSCLSRKEDEGIQSNTSIPYIYPVFFKELSQVFKKIRIFSSKKIDDPLELIRPSALEYNPVTETYYRVLK